MLLDFVISYCFERTKTAFCQSIVLKNKPELIYFFIFLNQFIFHLFIKPLFENKGLINIFLLN